MNRGSSGRHERRSIRLQGYDYAGVGAYFVTICTHARVCLLGEIAGGAIMTNAAGRAVEAIWNELPQRFTDIELDAMVIMPNHIHFIVHIKAPVGAIHESPLHECSPHTTQSRRNMLLPKIIGYFKMNSAKRINEQRQTPGVPVWQRNYYERVIRNNDELTRAREYIVNNPLKWDLDRENPVNARYDGGNSHMGNCRGGDS
jgi:putative transposase